MNVKKNYEHIFKITCLDLIREMSERTIISKNIKIKTENLSLNRKAPRDHFTKRL